jgi:hypothetical protein
VIWRWRRAPWECPDWCGGANFCTAQHRYPAGEHRSEPLRVELTWGVLVATRAQGPTAPSRLEVRLQVALSDGEREAHAQAAAVAHEIDIAIQAAILSAGWIDVNEPDLPKLGR